VRLRQIRTLEKQPVIDDQQNFVYKKDMIQTVTFFGMLYLAKILAFASRILQRGSGTALPGLLVETKIPWIIAEFAEKLDAVIYISGTNGKTTTRAMMVDALEKQGVQVLTNRGGANIFRGIASALFENTGLNGQPRHRIAVLEVEEATLPKLSTYLPPQLLILTNIFRDQLDAYGEIDTTLEYFQKTIRSARPHVIVNGDDAKLLTAIAQECDRSAVTTFGLQQETEYQPGFEGEQVDMQIDLDTLITNIHPDSGLYHFTVQQGDIETNGITLLPGRYNIYNYAAAIAGLNHIRQLLTLDGSVDTDIQHLQTFQPVFGRGERMRLGTSDTTLILVKNPAGCNQVLQWIQEMYTTQAFHLVICINDNIADGKDVSWLWDTDFEEFQQNMQDNPPLSIITSGTRGNDMALRLQYAQFDVTQSIVIPDFNKVIQNITNRNDEVPTLVLSTYTALLDMRKKIGNIVKLADIRDGGN